MTKEALTLALEALKLHEKIMHPYCDQQTERALKAIEEALQSNEQVDESAAYNEWLSGTIHRHEKTRAMAWDAWMARAAIKTHPPVPTAQPEQEKERCVGCEACIDTACGRDECPNGWPKAAQPEKDIPKIGCVNHDCDKCKAQPEQEPKHVATVAEVHMSRYTIEWTNGPLPEGAKLYDAPQPKEPEQEPVAWAMLHDNGDFIDAINLEEHARVEGQYKHPLYTTPPQRTWVGLTPEEQAYIYTKWDEDKGWGPLVEAIEAKLKEKNSG